MLYATKTEMAAIVAGEDGGGGVALWGSIVGVITDQPDLVYQLNGKQNKLVAGDGITIDTSNPLHPVISAALAGGGGGGGGTWGSIVGDLPDQEDLQAALDAKQTAYVAGNGINIDVTDPETPVISVTLEAPQMGIEMTELYVAEAVPAFGYQMGHIDLSKLYALTRIDVDTGVRVRLYATEAQQLADYSRPLGTDPDPTTDHGLIYEFASEENATMYMSPVVIGADFGTTGIPITINNPYEWDSWSEITFKYWDLSAASGLGVSTGVIGQGITHIRAISRTAYNALYPPHPTTLYVIDETA